MTRVDSAPSTVGDVLFGDASLDVAAACRVSLSVLAELGDLTLEAIRTAHAQIAAVVAGQLGQLDLDELIMSGWRTYTALTAAADRTLATPGSEEVVALATHRITTKHELPVDVFVDNVKFATLHFELTLTADIDGLVAVVSHGDLIGLRSGRCRLTAALALDGTELGRRKATLTLPYLVRPGTGIPLRPRREHRDDRSPVAAARTRARIAARRPEDDPAVSRRKR